MGNASVKKKDWDKYEDLLQQGKSENVVRKAFDRKYAAKLKGKGDETWGQFMEGYREKYPKKKSQKKRQPENDPEENAALAVSPSYSEIEDDVWHEKIQSVLSEIKSDRLQYRRDIVEAHQKEVAKLTSQEQWTVKLKVKGRYQKRYKQNSPRKNTACYWQVELMEDLGGDPAEGDFLPSDDLPEPRLEMKHQKTMDATTPNYEDFDQLDQERNINRSSRSLSGLSTGSGHIPLGLVNAYSNGSMHSLPGGYVVPDNMSVVSGGSNISYVSQPQTIVDQNGRVSVLVGGNVGVPMMMTQSNPSPYVTQQPQYVMQQPMMQPQYVMQNQPQQYVVQQNSMHGVPIHGVPMQSYGSQASLHTLPRGDTQTSVLSTDTTKSTRSTKRDRPRTRQKRKSQKGS